MDPTAIAAAAATAAKAAFVLITMSSMPTADYRDVPSAIIAMQEFSSKDSCEAAEKALGNEMQPKKALWFRSKCVPK